MRTELAPEWTDQAFVMPNADTLAKAVEGVAPVEPSRPLRVEPPKTPMSFEQWQAVILDNFPAYARPAEICASVFAQLLLNDVANPFALCLVDVPSSGKTITLNFFDVPELAYTSDSFTPASFVSHASNIKREELAKVDLLPRIRYRVMLLAEHKSLETKTKTGLSRAVAKAAEHASTKPPLEVTNTAQLRDLAAAASRVFGWDKGSGSQVTLNQLVVTQEQLEQIRALREPVAYEAPQPEIPPQPFPAPSYGPVDYELKITSDGVFGRNTNMPTKKEHQD